MLKDEIRQIIQDNTWEDVDSPQTLIDEDGINCAVEEILSLLLKVAKKKDNIPKRERWRKIGRNNDEEILYQNDKGQIVIEKDHRYLIDYTL